MPDLAAGAEILEVLEQDAVVDVTQPAPATLEVVAAMPATIAVEETPAIVVEVIEAGPQGPEGPGVPPAVVAAQVDALVAGYLQAKPAQVYRFDAPVSTWPMPHSFGRIPAVTLYSLTGRRIYTDVYADEVSATAHFPMPVPGIAVLT